MTDRRVTQCTGHTKKGLGPRCKRRTSRTNLCWTHLASEEGLKIKPSRIPNAGLGLFATKDFQIRKPVAPYTGRHISRPNEGYGGPYVLQLPPYRTPFKYVDANRSTDGAGRYSNTSRRGNPGVNNSRLMPDPDDRNVGRIMSTTAIPKGREILTRYGPDYNWD